MNIVISCAVIEYKDRIMLEKGFANGAVFEFLCHTYQTHGNTHNYDSKVLVVL